MGLLAGVCKPEGRVDVLVTVLALVLGVVGFNLAAVPRGIGVLLRFTLGVILATTLFFAVFFDCGADFVALLAELAEGLVFVLALITFFLLTGFFLTAAMEPAFRSAPVFALAFCFIFAFAAKARFVLNLTADGLPADDLTAVEAALLRAVLAGLRGGLTTGLSIVFLPVLRALVPGAADLPVARAFGGSFAATFAPTFAAVFTTVFTIALAAAFNLRALTAAVFAALVLAAIVADFCRTALSSPGFVVADLLLVADFLTAPALDGLFLRAVFFDTALLPAAAPGFAFGDERAGFRRVAVITGFVLAALRAVLFAAVLRAVFAICRTSTNCTYSVLCHGPL